MPPARDPKDIVTPYAFRLEPRLLGIPLASPFRRGAAMLVDLTLLALFLLLREISGALLGIVIAWVLFRISARGAEEGVEGPVARPLVRISAVIVLFVSVAVMFGSCFGGSERRGSAPAESPRGGVETGASPRLGHAVGLMTAAGRVVAAGDSASAQAAADRFAALLARTDVPRGEREEALRELLRAEEAAWRAAVARLAVERSADDPGTTEADADPATTGTHTGPGAVEAGADSGLPDTLPREMRAVAEALEAASQRPQRERSRRDPGIMGFLRSIANDLGLGIGWAGLYFTIFTVLMKGRTPGKRLLGVRVVRLNGQPIGWWGAFSRFGGYAAGLATGLIGFLQIFWDANRQGLHDKIVHTVVIRTRGPGTGRPAG